jgi:hypothetical protein
MKFPWRRRPRTRRCTNCDAQALPIVYGLPGSETFEAVERGEVAIGGCMPAPERWACPACKHKF